eukprot:c9126_g1_i9.p1 GENE.c9126_g1_i9~~c9126_g1_i9.p1  ORF type:complete len:258 (-),score=64.94 c9126_g1_i9:383-1087(-)
MGISLWGDDSDMLAARFVGATSDLSRIKDTCRDNTDVSTLHPCVFQACDIAETLLLDVQDLGHEFALTLENERSATLSLQLANLKIAELQRRLKLVGELPGDGLGPLKSEDAGDGTAGGGAGASRGRKASRSSFNKGTSFLRGGSLANVNLFPTTENEVEETIDQLMDHAVTKISNNANDTAPSGVAIKNLNKYVKKTNRNTFDVAGNSVQLVFRDRSILVRIGGGTHTHLEAF